VLSSLYALHLPILSVENLTETNSGVEGQLDPAKSAPSEPEREDRTK
jgi:hypothetical protein